jgi:hypothetical protein
MSIPPLRRPKYFIRHFHGEYEGYSVLARATLQLGTKVPAFQKNLLHPSSGLKKDTVGSSKMLVICAKHHGVTPHKTISLVSYPVHKTSNPISLTAICMKIQSFLTYDAVSTGNARKGLLRPSAWRQQAPPQHLYLFTNRHDVISKKTLIFTNITAR